MVEGSLQERDHHVRCLLIKWLSRSGVLIGIRILNALHLRSHLQQQQQGGILGLELVIPEMRYQANEQKQCWTRELRNADKYDCNCKGP